MPLFTPKIKNGTVTVEPGELLIGDLVEYIVRHFKPLAEAKGLNFEVEFEPAQSFATMVTDSDLLARILTQLLSNALKFTDHGKVNLRIATPTEGWSKTKTLCNANVIAFAVSDTGIGIHTDRQQIIFEGFPFFNELKASNGLGLAMSHEISRLLGGQIRVDSALGRGSTFTLFLPRNWTLKT